MCFLIGNKIIKKKEENVLIYCTSGTNGSCLISSLSQIIIEPHYRTFEGFKVLVWKEWIYFQHNFVAKNDLNKLNIEDECRYLPLFIFFLDCVAQLIHMNPFKFEFTKDYLAQLSMRVLSNKFFEFVQSGYQQNLEKDQSNIKLVSVFSVIKQDHYTNQFYKKDKDYLRIKTNQFQLNQTLQE